MKVGIISFSSAHNYGAVYQVYALQTFLENKGYEVSVINYRPPAIDNVYKLYKFKPSKKKLKNYLKKGKKIVEVNMKTPWKVKRSKNFESFINNVLNTTEEFRSLKSLKNYNEKFDVLIAGSDQIWNTGLTKKFDPSYFLNFGGKDVIKISYAASLGSDEVKDEDKKLFERYLKNFDHISIRESSSKRALSKLTDSNIEVVQDPTLLLEKKYFDELKKQSKYDNKKYIYVHFIGKIDNDVVKIAEHVSKVKKIPVLHTGKKSMFSNELDSNVCVSPEQMLSIIENAEMVISNSFHFTVLPIIYNKEFITIPHKVRPQRMQDLLKKFKLEDHLTNDIKQVNRLLKTRINYDIVNRKVINQRKKSIEFLDNSFKIGKVKDSNFFKNSHKVTCYGCELCSKICPVDAITMTEDEEGFKYPLIDKDKCIKCGKCSNLCIYKNNEQKTDLTKIKVYAAQNKNKDILLNSTSGGVVDSITNFILEKKGYIVGVRYDDNMMPIYDIASTKKKADKFKGSKYVEAKTNDIYEKVKEQLDKQKYVAFVGSPCKIAALRKYLKKDYDKLYLIDIICHGVPSSKVFNEYIKYLESKYNKKIIDFKFRHKVDSWNKMFVKVSFEDGSTKEELANANNYNRAFLNNYILRPSCYNCEFAGNNGITDLTLGDYWGVEGVFPALNDDKGTSIIKLNSKKGLKLFKSIRKDFKITLSSYEDAYKKNHSEPCLFTKKRVNFMEKIDYKNIDAFLEKNNRFKIVYKNNSEEKAIKNRNNSI